MKNGRCRQQTFSFCLLLAGIGIILLAACAGGGNRLTQTSTIDALLAGVYDGEMSCRELLRHGNFGIGTFDHLDGEMVVLDGMVYQVKVDGKVQRPKPDQKTPFAVIAEFQADSQPEIPVGLDFAALKKELDRLFPNQNQFIAFRLDGAFSRMKVRSVPAQEKPYRPLAEVVKEQKIYQLGAVSGTVVGFRSPPFVKGINVPGYHFHFLDEQRRAGGHILDLETGALVCRVDRLNTFTLILPEDDAALAGLDLGRDRSQALEKVEK